MEEASGIKGREIIPMMESMINQIEEQQNLMAEMVQELQERDRHLLSLQEQNQSLQTLNSELSGLLNLLPDTEELLSQIEQQKTRIGQLETENQQWQELTQKLNSENRAENIEALQTRLRQTEQQLTSEINSMKRADAKVVAWKFKYEKAEQAKHYAQTHQKTVEVAVEKKVAYEKCENCNRTAYQKAKEKCDNRKIQLEKKYKNMTTGYESLMFLLAWYSTATTLFAAILSPVFLNDCITFFGSLGKGIVSLLQEFVTGADSFGQLSNGISNSIVSGIVYWLIAAIVMGSLFIITGFLIIEIGYQVGKIHRKYCWDILSIMMAIMSTAIVIYFGEWIKSVIPINLIVLLLLVHVIYIGIRCYVKDWWEEQGYY